MKHISALFSLLAMSGFTPLLALDAGDLAEIVGYTAVTSSNVTGDFEGADHGKVVKLDNGMIFEFAEYSYSYTYHPDVVVFAKTVDAADLKRIAPNRTFSGSITLYKLVIDDEIYDARRVR